VKKYAVLILPLLVSCAFLFPVKFDPIEMEYYTIILKNARHLEQSCGDPQAEKENLVTLNNVGELINLYTQFQPDETSKLFATNINKLIEHHKPSRNKVYCIESAKNIQSATGRVMETLGKRSR
jgi:hypothetical protein